MPPYRNRFLNRGTFEAEDLIRVDRPGLWFRCMGCDLAVPAFDFPVPLVHQGCGEWLPVLGRGIRIEENTMSEITQKNGQ
jgi:hypothetical protein